MRSNQKGNKDLAEYTFSHELGHALGYHGHSTVEHSLMYYEITPNYNNWQPLTEESVSVLSMIYKECHINE